MAMPLATAPNISAMAPMFVGSFEKSIGEEREDGKVVSRSGGVRLSSRSSCAQYACAKASLGAARDGRHQKPTFLRTI